MQAVLRSGVWVLAHALALALGVAACAGLWTLAPMAARGWVHVNNEERETESRGARAAHPNAEAKMGCCGR